MNNTEAVVSVIMPVYNHADFVEKTLESIANQTWQAIELIIINDGSSDHSAEVISNCLERLRARFLRVEFIDRPNKGLVKTMNEAAGLATGQYLAGIASDDAYVPQALATLVEFLEKNPEYVLAVGDNGLMDDDGERCYWNAARQNVYSKEKAKYETFGDYLKNSRRELDFDSENFGSYISLIKGNHVPNGYVFRREVFVEFGGYDEEVLIDDHKLMLNLAKYGKMKFIDEILFIYRWHSNNTIKNLSKNQELMMNVLESEKEYSRSDPDKMKAWQKEWSNAQVKTGFERLLWRWKRSILKRLSK